MEEASRQAVHMALAGDWSCIIGAGVIACLLAGLATILRGGK